MKVFFEIHTTSCRPIMCAVDDEYTIDEIYEILVDSIENNTMLDRYSIRDLFMQNNNKTKILSIIPEYNYTQLKEFMRNNVEYFDPRAINRMANIYKIYVIDDVYLQRKSENKPAPVYDESTLHETPSISFITMIKETVGAFYIKL